MDKNKVIVLNILFLIVTGRAICGGLDITQIPVGKSVTIPHTTAAIIPLGQRVRLSSTNIPQTIKFSVDYKRSPQVPDVSIAIYDSKASRVKYIDLKPNDSVIYAFESLGSIQVIPRTENRRNYRKMVKIIAVSDRPLGISR